MSQSSKPTSRRVRELARVHSESKRMDGVIEESDVSRDALVSGAYDAVPYLPLVVMRALDVPSIAADSEARALFDEIGSDGGVYAMLGALCGPGTPSAALFYAANEEALRAGVGAVIVDYALQAHQQRARAAATGDTSTRRQYETQVKALSVPSADGVGVLLLPDGGTSVVYERDEQIQAVFSALAEFAQQVDVDVSEPSDEERANGIEAHVECRFVLALVPLASKTSSAMSAASHAPLGARAPLSPRKLND